jgi:hypothetical protein
MQSAGGIVIEGLDRTAPIQKENMPSEIQGLVPSPIPRQPLAPGALPTDPGTASLAIRNSPRYLLRHENNFDPNVYSPERLIEQNINEKRRGGVIGRI